MTLSFRTDRSGQTVQTQIRLLLEEQFDQGLQCLLFHLHDFDKIPSGLVSLFEFKVNYSKDSCVRKFRNFTVHCYIIIVGEFLWHRERGRWGGADQESSQPLPEQAGE